MDARQLLVARVQNSKNLLNWAIKDSFLNKTSYI